MEVKHLLEKEWARPAEDILFRRSKLGLIMPEMGLKKLNLSAKSYQFDTRQTMILSGRYLGYMPQSYIQQELNAGEIRIIQPSVLTYQFNLSLVSNKSPREANKVKLLRNAFNTAFNLMEKRPNMTLFS